MHVFPINYTSFFENKYSALIIDTLTSARVAPVRLAILDSLLQFGTVQAFFPPSLAGNFGIRTALERF